MQLDIYTHYFKVTEFNQVEHSALLKFCMHLSHSELVQDEFGNKKEQLTETYAARTQSLSEYRFIISCLDIFLRFCDITRGIPIKSFKTIDHRSDKPFGLPVKLVADPSFIPRDYQPPMINFAARLSVEGRTIAPLYKRVLEVQMGKGKGIVNSGKIKIPGGWTTMGKVKVGDVVTAADGSQCNVIGVYPQGLKDIYKVTFADGRHVTVDAEHLWKVYYVNTTIKRRWRIVNTLEVIRMLGMHEPRVYVPLCESEEGPDVELPINPYLLGVILGDGYIGAKEVVVTKSDMEIFDKISTLLPEDIKLVKRTSSDGSRCLSFGLARASGDSNSIIAKLKDLNLQGTLANSKFIPEQYLNGSTQQRLELLQGLMDTDGTIQSIRVGNSISYCSVSEQLAKDVQYLVRSLGGIARISSRIPKYTLRGEKKEGQRAYNVLIRFKKPSQLFTLSRKKERTNDNGQYASDLKLRISSVVPVGQEETTCILIDHPDHLFITDDFIVTHNTKMALQAIARLSQRVVAILKPMYMGKWVGDIKENFSGFPGAIYEKKDICTVSGNKQLSDLIAAAKGDYLEAKFIIISNRTLQIFIEEYEAGLDVTERYGCKPDELFEILKAGVKLGDEVHEYFHFNFKMDLYTHNVLSIELSATLEPGGHFLKDMYKLMFPPECRISMAFHKYVEAISLNYRLADPKKVRCKMRGMYNHGQFEKSITHHKRMKRDYFEFVKELIDWTFIEGYGDGDRLLVFFYLVDTCKDFAELVKEVYPELKTTVYVGGSKEEELSKNDIIISTLKSCGTARDIPDLTRVINTIATDTPQGNLQYMGRLRELKNRPNVVPRYYYLTAENNDKHVKYHNNKRKLFDGKVVSHTVINTGVVI